jgi:hypothetical protein
MIRPHAGVLPVCSPRMPQVLQLETAQDRLPKSDTAAPRIGQYGLGYVQSIAGHDSDLRFCGVSDGIRTHDTQDHNLVL